MSTTLCALRSLTSLRGLSKTSLSCVRCLNSVLISAKLNKMTTSLTLSSALTLNRLMRKSIRSRERLRISEERPKMTSDATNLSISLSHKCTHLCLNAIKRRVMPACATTIRNTITRLSQLKTRSCRLAYRNSKI
jgi:hypothetical protein